MKEFWKHKKLEEMDKEEWESLCDCCGKCCLNKIDFDDKVCWTRTHCRFFDTSNCLCKVYYNRFEVMHDCRDITLSAVRERPRWLPKTCAYWLLDNGQDLPDWHYLVCGDKEAVHQQKMSLQNRDTISETGVKDFEAEIIDWEDL